MFITKAGHILTGHFAQIYIHHPALHLSNRLRRTHCPIETLHLVQFAKALRIKCKYAKILQINPLFDGSSQTKEPAMAEKAAKSSKNTRKLKGADRKKLASRQHRPRILEYIANNLYEGVNRSKVVNDLLSSTVYSKAEESTVRAAIAKTLGRLIHDRTLSENLTIGERSQSAKTKSNPKRHRGYVAVTVSTSGIRAARDPTIKHKGLSMDVTSQEQVIRWIANETRNWNPNSEGGDSPKDDGQRVDSKGTHIRWPREIILLDIAITHSSAWDILISVSYREADEFMRYVRDVVQMAPHVMSTQTMFVAGSLPQIMESGGNSGRTGSPPMTEPM